jgi:hypothetical protein
MIEETYIPSAAEVKSVIKETNIKGYQDRIASISTAITWGVAFEKNGSLEYEYALSKENRKKLEELVIKLAVKMVEL